MDTELLKTFIEVSKTRHFGRAAESLYLTQSAVSSRIRLLENQLGVNLFTRHRNNIRLTPSGEQLLPYAENLIHTWQQARNVVTKSSQKNGILSIGAVSLIWEIELNNWLENLYLQNKNLQIEAKIAPRNQLVQQLHERQLDLLIATEPPKMDELSSELLGYIPLKLFTWDNKNSDNKCTYISLDWGADFIQREEDIYPQESSISLITPSAKMAKQLLKSTGSCAYLPAYWQIQNPDLKIVPQSSTIQQSLHAIWLQNSDQESLIRNLLKNQIIPKDE
ncbi:HTH-type transcriptional regulator HdfR [Budvicia diplopodorum]|uniref:HTH-type transcriptional regulator HdfR n=1 Tax=Budvicia diplopodorum TaxID=1119056 RepID=UPI00135813F5|nr:HTH-type transcriptional regulator HdfR [Budvicia diplopodorum]